MPSHTLVEKRDATDNAVMIAWASMHRFAEGNTDGYGILIRPKWGIQDLMRAEIDETPSYDIAK